MRLVEVLTGLCDQNLPFGFISFQAAASDDRDRGSADYNLTRILDRLLSASESYHESGKTRDATSFALLVLADATAARLVAYA
jgi:hypothetical protein